MYEAINARINAGVIIANIIPIIRFVQHNISDINMYNKKPINPHIIVTNTLINFLNRTYFIRLSSDYQDSNLKYQNQNLMCCQLHHSPIIQLFSRTTVFKTSI